MYPAKGYMRLKDRTTVHCTVTAGTHGVQEQLSRELSMRVNVWYGEGEDEIGTRWRNSYPSADGTGLFFQPLPGAYDPEVHPLDENPNGTLTSDDSRLDTNKFRLEGYANLGQGVGKDEASRLLAGEYSRNQDPGWVGNLNLTTDPVEMSRRKIRDGMNIQLDGFENSGVLLHISRHELSDPYGNAQSNLTLDTKARDLDYIQAYLDRKQAEVKNPVKRLLIGRSSQSTVDSAQPWDTERGDGYLPRNRAPVFNGGVEGGQTVIVPKQTYTVQRITVGEEEVITKSEFYSNPPAILHISICDAPPAGASTTAEYWTGPLVAIAGWPADPMAQGAWENPDYPVPEEQLVAWGQYGQAGGYSPGSQTNPYRGLTGAIVDEGEWNLTHANVPAEQRRPTYVWVVMWAHDRATTIYGRLSRQRKVR
jgi:hypothetical protein